MIFIAHRGNTNGPRPEKENTQDYILDAIAKGYDVEIDVWADKKLWLGHDEPQYQVDVKFLTKHFNKLWIHCKNLEAIYILYDFILFNFFWNQIDYFKFIS